MAGRVGGRPQFDDPHVVVERRREMHGDWCRAADSVDCGRQRRGVVHNQQVARFQVVAEIGEPAVGNAIRGRDHQLDAVAGDTVRLGWLDRVGSRSALEVGAWHRDGHASAPMASMSSAR